MSTPDCEIFNAASISISNQPDKANIIIFVLTLITTFIEVVRDVKTCDGKDISDNDGFCKFTEAMMQSGAFFNGFASLTTLDSLYRTLLSKMLYYLDAHILAQHGFSKRGLALVYKDIINKLVTKLILSITPSFLTNSLTKPCACVPTYEAVILNECTLVLSPYALSNIDPVNQYFVSMGLNLTANDILTIINTQILRTCSIKPCNKGQQDRNAENLRSLICELRYQNKCRRVCD
jgi:hypothetical protein